MVFLRRLLPRLRVPTSRIAASSSFSQPPFPLLRYHDINAEDAGISLRRQRSLAPFPFSIPWRSFAKAKKSSTLGEVVAYPSRWTLAMDNKRYSWRSGSLPVKVDLGHGQQEASTNMWEEGDEDSVAGYEDVYPSVKENAVTQMEAGLDSLSRELSKLRTGRVSAGMLDHVTVVDNNGIRSPLTHVAAVTVMDNEKLRVTPFDSSIVKCVERGVRSSPLKLNPIVEGDTISVPVPKPTKEYVETMLKVVGKAAETAKMSIRRARQTAMDAIKKSTGHVSKDDIKRREKEIEELTKKFVKTVDDTCKAKEKEMLPG